MTQHPSEEYSFLEAPNTPIDRPSEHDPFLGTPQPRKQSLQQEEETRPSADSTGRQGLLVLGGGLVYDKYNHTSQPAPARWMARGRVSKCVPLGTSARELSTANWMAKWLGWYA